MERSSVRYKHDWGRKGLINVSLIYLGWKMDRRVNKHVCLFISSFMLLLKKHIQFASLLWMIIAEKIELRVEGSVGGCVMQYSMLAEAELSIAVSLKYYWISGLPSIRGGKSRGQKVKVMSLVSSARELSRLISLISSTSCLKNYAH